MLELFWPGVEPVSPDEYRDLGMIESAPIEAVSDVRGCAPDSGYRASGGCPISLSIANHPFANGNKRTAVLALDLFFIANGYYLALSPDEMHDLAVRTAAYRERGLGHDEIMNDIVSAFTGSMISFEELDTPTAESLLPLRDSFRSLPDGFVRCVSTPGG